MSRRERKVLALQLAGHSDKKIAYLMREWDKADKRINRDNK